MAMVASAITTLAAAVTVVDSAISTISYPYQIDRLCPQRKRYWFRKLR